jgi:hypothetical protein
MQKSLYLVLFVTLGLTSNAFAYGDPAAGGFLIQVLLAGGLASVAVVRCHFGRIVDFFKLKARGPRSPRLGND